MSEAQRRACALTVARRRDGDWPGLLRLWVASWRAAYPEIDFEARRDWLTEHVAEIEAAGGVTLCLFDGGAPIGFVVIDPATGWLDQICVAPDRFGTGAASALLDAARAASPARIRLDVNADNARAIRFYEREGFLRVGSGAPSLSGRPTLVMEWPANRLETQGDFAQFSEPE